jgi:hypothetical protein
MRTPIRLAILFTALVAFLVTGLMPAAGSWSCPDGTACVYTPGRGFHCEGDECRMACCVGRKTRHGCGQCDHGSFPVAHARPRAARPALSGTEPCRYREPAQAERVAARPSHLQVTYGQAVAVLPAPPNPPLAAGFCVRSTPIRGSPPARPFLTPSSPRAPPERDCA